MRKEQQRHDISDEVWRLLEPHLPGQSGQWGGIEKDNRKFMNGVFWILRMGVSWRDYRLAMENGVQYISDSVAGERKVPGKNYLRFW